MPPIHVHQRSHCVEDAPWEQDLHVRCSALCVQEVTVGWVTNWWQLHSLVVIIKILVPQSRRLDSYFSCYRSFLQNQNDLASFDLLIQFVSVSEMFVPFSLSSFRTKTISWFVNWLFFKLNCTTCTLQLLSSEDFRLLSFPTEHFSALGNNDGHIWLFP